MRETVTLLGGPADGQRVPRERPVWKPTAVDHDYPFEVLGPVDYTADEIGFIWPVRVAEVIDEELGQIAEYHDVSRREHFAGDPFVRYGMLLPEDAIAYRIRFWTTWLRRRRIAEQMFKVKIVLMHMAVPHPMLRGYEEEVEQIAREELRELAKLLTPKADQ